MRNQVDTRTAMLPQASSLNPCGWKVVQNLPPVVRWNGEVLHHLWGRVP